MTNPFEDEADLYLVLQNQRGEFSLWPSAIRVPDGWTKQHGPDTRAVCLSYIELHWTDMRPYR